MGTRWEGGTGRDGPGKVQSRASRAGPQAQLLHRTDSAWPGCVWVLLRGQRLGLMAFMGPPPRLPGPLSVLPRPVQKPSPTYSTNNSAPCSQDCLGRASLGRGIEVHPRPCADGKTCSRGSPGQTGSPPQPPTAATAKGRVRRPAWVLPSLPCTTS